jgi:urea transporter
LSVAPAIQDVKGYLLGIVRSYASIYFSQSTWLGLVLMAVSFFDLGTGISGIIAILVCQLCGTLFYFSKTAIVDGSYSYNALMTGLALGSLYQVSTAYFAVLIIASMLTFFLTVWIAGRLSPKGLPFLSLPFLLTIWVLLAGLSNFSGLQLNAKASFSLSQWIPGIFEWTNNQVTDSRIGDMIHIYLRSLSAILFQYNDLAGIIIAIALLIRSRMAFALSIYGFLIGYAFYYFLEGDLTPLIYSYIGFNFILTAIALGGFFLVPSAKSHLLLFFAIPVTALLLSALHTVFTRLHLPLYSFPFNIIVLLLLAALQMRQKAKGLQIVTLQQYSPEDNHYKSVYYNKRFAGQVYYPVQLPFIGEWHISQGYNGDITHKDAWQHALDFDIRDEQEHTFSGTGYQLRDYYCYDLPVLAPAAGYVVLIKDGIPDNTIGDTNLNDNWGNTIILKHADGLYSKLSHLKPHSFKVKEGAYVQAGELIAVCGSSGRSPEPHLHFQLQAFPHIGAQTLAYPLSSYLVKKQGRYSYHSFEVPPEGAVVRKVISTPILYQAFNFVAGGEITWRVEQSGNSTLQTWNVQVDIYNRPYLYCTESKATAFFYNDGTLFYFTDFSGGQTSFLYQFYISFQKVLLGYYKGISIRDSLIPHTFFGPLVMAGHDFIAPFFHLLKGTYQFEFAPATAGHHDSITIQTISQGLLRNKAVKTVTASMTISKDGITSVEINRAPLKITATCV